MNIIRHNLLILVFVLFAMTYVMAQDSAFTIGPLKTRGAYTRFMMAYTNQTTTAYTHVTVQCVGFSEDGLPVGEAKKAWDVRLNDVPILPKQTVYQEMLIRHGGAVITSVRCTVIKAKSR